MLVYMVVKKSKKSRKQKGRGDYPPTFEQWYASPMSDNAKYRVSIGDSSQLDEKRNWYLARAGKAYKKPSDIDESKYVVPKSDLGNFIQDNHIISKTLGGLVGAATNLIVPFSGIVTGSAATYGLQQLGLGKKPRRPSGKHPMHGSGLQSALAALQKTLASKAHPMRRAHTAKPMTGGNSPFLLTNNSSFNSVKF